MAVLKLHVRSARRGRAGGRSRGGLSPLRAIMAACAVLLFGLFLYVLWQSRWIDRQMEAMVGGFWNVTALLGFEVKNVVVEGRKSTEPYNLLQAMGLKTGTPILAFRPEEAQTSVRELPWVGDASVERYLPHTVVVRLSERQPMARWQAEGAVRVVDTDGRVIDTASAGDFTHLPLIIGKQADETARDLFTALARFPTVGKHVQTATRVSERRWDVHLGARVIAKLPEKNMDEALQRLAVAIAEQRILERDVIAVDLRQPDRLVLESSQPIAPLARQTPQPKM